MSDPSENVKKEEPKVDKDLPVFPSSSSEPGGGGSQPAIDDKPKVQDKRL